MSAYHRLTLGGELFRNRRYRRVADHGLHALARRGAERPIGDDRDAELLRLCVRELPAVSAVFLAKVRARDAFSKRRDPRRERAVPLPFPRPPPTRSIR